MGSSCVYVPLNDFITLQRGFDLPQNDRISGVYPVVASTDIVGYHNEWKVEAPGVVIGRSGSIGGGQYITENFWPLNTTLWVKDFKNHNPRYVYYLLKSIDFSSFNVGSGVPTLNRNHLSSILVRDLGKKTEDQIAQYLGQLDEKITLNRQINQTLEQMAQTLFKSWFVDFDPVIDNALDAGNEIPEVLQARAELRQKVRASQDFQPLPADVRALFPAEFEESALGWVPKGWVISSLKDLSEKISKGTTPRTSDLDNSEDDLIVPFLKVKDITDDGNILSNALELIPTSVSNTVLKRSILNAGDILISIAGTIGRVAVLDKKLDKSNCNQAVAFVRLLDGERYREFVRLTMRSIDTQNFINSQIVQGVQANLSLTCLGDIQMVTPNHSVIDKFNYFLVPNVNKKYVALNETQTLTQLRDTLLPKLISGELRLDDLPDEVVTAANE